MLAVVAYDICSRGKAGKNRLRNAAKCCEAYGVAVQRSVYECELRAEELEELKKRLRRIIDEGSDSVRIYRLGKHYHSRIETLGREPLLWDRESYVIGKQI